MSGRRRRLAFLAVGALAAAIGVAAYAVGLLHGLELESVDARYSVRGARAPSDRVVVVEVDDVTFDQLGLQWPFPRSVHARAIDRLREAGARVIAYDVQFTEPTQPRQDEALILAVERAGDVVLATTEVDAHGRANVFGGEAVLRQIGAEAGNTVVKQDSDGTVRRFSRQIQGLRGFAVRAAEGPAPRRRAKPVPGSSTRARRTRSPGSPSPGWSRGRSIPASSATRSSSSAPPPPSCRMSTRRPPGRG